METARLSMIFCAPRSARYLVRIVSVCVTLLSSSRYEQKKSISIWAVMMRRNMVSG